MSAAEARAMAAGLDLVHAALAPERAAVVAAGLDDPTEAERRKIWLADRREAVTGTDLRRLMLNEDGGPMRVWLEKKGLAAETITNERMRWGVRLQAGILQGYAEEFGIAVQEQDPYLLVRVPDCPILGASLDGRWVEGDLRPVDAKNVGWRKPWDQAAGEGWGDDLTDQVPFRYALQVSLQAMACVAPVGELAPLFGGNRLGRFIVPLDPEIAAAIREAATTFWERHILADVPPPVDATEGWTGYLKDRFKKAGAELLEATEEDVRWIRQRAEAKAAEEAAKKLKDEAENHLKLRMGTAAGIAGVCTWKNNKDSEGPDLEAIARVLLAETSPERREELLAAHHITKPGARVFRSTYKEA